MVDTQKVLIESMNRYLKAFMGFGTEKILNKHLLNEEVSE